MLSTCYLYATQFSGGHGGRAHLLGSEVVLYVIEMLENMHQVLHYILEAVEGRLRLLEVLELLVLEVVKVFRCVLLCILEVMYWVLLGILETVDDGSVFGFLNFHCSKFSLQPAIH